MKLIKKTLLMPDGLNYRDLTIPITHNYVLEDGTVVHNCGVGFSVQKQHINLLPKISSEPRLTSKTYVVEDSIEGWADAVGVLINSYLIKPLEFSEYKNFKIEFDMSKIRPVGSLIAGQFKAPGPNGLMKSLELIDSVIQARVSSDDFNKGEFKNKLRPIDAYDIIMHISNSVLSGGVRRCLPENYLVKIGPDEYQKISECTVNDSVYLNDEYHKITNIFEQGKQEVVKFITTDGNHISTPNHKWLVYDKTTKEISWKTADDMIHNVTNFAFVQEDND